jgi:hypothetical protein
MRYTVITGKGKVFCFYIKDLAVTYASLYNGVLITEQILNDVVEKQQIS